MAWGRGGLKLGASGISVTSRLLGGAIGMAVGRSLHVATGYFEAVFLVTGVVTLVAAVFGWFAIEGEESRVRQGS